MVAANIARHLREHAGRPARQLEAAGLLLARRAAQRLDGHVAAPGRLGRAATRRRLQELSAPCHHADRCAHAAADLRVICGATGSAKTRVLHALAARGEQVLDLEDFANHKGSLLGDLPGVPQPSQKHFETRIATVLEGHRPGAPAVRRRRERAHRPARRCRCRWWRACARRRASKYVPRPRRGWPTCCATTPTWATTAKRWPTRWAVLKEMQGKETVTRWQQWAHEAGDLPHLFAELMALHYDPHYERRKSALQGLGPTPERGGDRPVGSGHRGGGRCGAGARRAREPVGIEHTARRAA
jgi:tRNA 2-selenouridine synthase